MAGSTNDAHRHGSIRIIWLGFEYFNQATFMRDTNAFFIAFADIAEAKTVQFFFYDDGLFARPVVCNFEGFDQQVMQINDAITTSDWKYEKVKDGNDQLTWSRSTETFTDHTHTLEKKTATTYSMHNGQVVLEHDANGVFTRYEHDVLGRVTAEIASPDMLNDECGNALYYDSLGRLHQVQDANGNVTAQYGYDGHDQLLYSGTDARKVQRRYLANSLDSLLEDGLLTEYLHAGGQPRAQQQAGSATLLLTDHAGSVNTEHDADGTRHARYAPYGEQQPEDAGQPLRSLLAFNGEARESAFGWYLLGSGYRAYNPGLMRFHSPDSLPPEEAGINPYVYALGNPVYWHDPTGHRSEHAGYGRQRPLERHYEEKPDVPWYAWVGAAILGAIFVVSAFTMPWTAPASIGLTVSYVVGVVGVAANAAAAFLQGVATANMYKDPEQANLLQTFSTVFSVVGSFAAGYGAATTKAAVSAAKSAAKGAQAAPAIANGGGQTIVQNIDNRVYNFIQKSSGRIMPRRPRAPIRMISEPGTSSVPGPSSASTSVSTSSSSAGRSAQASASTLSPPGAEMKPFLSGIPRGLPRPTGAPPSPHANQWGVFILGKNKGLGLKPGIDGKMDVFIA